MSRLQLTGGNRVLLLENGEEFYPRVFAAIEQAQREVLLETFIIADDAVGRRLRDALVGAAQRGVRTLLTVDGYGTAELPPQFLREMSAAGVVVHWFDPRPRWLGIRINPFRRLHRKLVLVDRSIAFVGGLNFSAEHLREFGELSKQDYAVEVKGPVVEQVRLAMEALVAPSSLLRWLGLRRTPRFEIRSGVSGAEAALVLRDNERHRQDIEQVYRLGIRQAQREVVIANAYFFPGYRLLRELRRAARRGVVVRLILQGRPDMRMVKWAAAALHDYLLRSGVHVHEYCERALHGKVAVIDSTWATVGSSNLDPLSLFLNLEANLVVRDRGFASDLRRRLDILIQHHCRELRAPEAGPSTPLRNLVGFGLFHLLRRLPSWAGWLPGHADKRVLLVDGHRE